MDLHIPAWIVYSVFYAVSGAVVSLLLGFALYFFQQRTVSMLKNLRYYWFARLLIWRKAKRDTEEKNIWEVIYLHAAYLRKENPDRFKHIVSMLRMGENQYRADRIKEAITQYLADPEHQKRSDMESVILDILETPYTGDEPFSAL
jgi:hypothetical protein